MRQETFDRWQSADDSEKLWLDLRDCISRYADIAGKFPGDARFVGPLRRFQEHADAEGDIKRDLELEGLRELDRDPADDWLRDAMGTS